MQAPEGAKVIVEKIEAESADVAIMPVGDLLHFWSSHNGGGAHVLFADGAARFLAYSAAPIMPALATRAGGEPAGDSN